MSADDWSKNESPGWLSTHTLLWLIFSPNKHDKYCTMLQKLSKSEHKAWLWNLIILQPLWFYMRLNFGKFKRSKNVILGNLRKSELWILVNLGHQSCSNSLKIKTQNLWNCQKWHFWTVWICQNLNSRKIWVTFRLSNFNKVKPWFHILKVSAA